MKRNRRGIEVKEELIIPRGRGSISVPFPYINEKIGTGWAKVLKEGLRIPATDELATIMWRLKEYGSEKRFPRTIAIPRKLIWASQGVYVVPVDFDFEAGGLNRLESKLKKEKRVKGVKTSSDESISFAPKETYCRGVNDRPGVREWLRDNGPFYATTTVEDYKRSIIQGDFRRAFDEGFIKIGEKHEQTLGDALENARRFFEGTPVEDYKMYIIRGDFTGDVDSLKSSSLPALEEFDVVFHTPDSLKNDGFFDAVFGNGVRDLVKTGEYCNGWRNDFPRVSAGCAREGYLVVTEGRLFGWGVAAAMQGAPMTFENLVRDTDEADFIGINPKG